MNLRVYLMLLRPVRTIVVIALFTLTAVVAIQLLTLRPTAFLVLAIVLPAATATALSSIIYEPLHRPFAAWLPEIGGQLRGFHTGASAIVAFGNVLALQAFVPDVSIAAACGLIAIPFGFRLVLPPHGRRRLSGLFLLIPAMIGVGYIHAWIVSYPWLPFVSGLSLAGTGLHLGFSRRRVRDLSGSFHLSTQSLLFSVTLLYLSRIQWAKVRPRGSRITSIDFPLVDGSTHSWMRAMWQSNVPRPMRVLGITTTLYFIMGMAMPAIAFWFAATGGSSGPGSISLAQSLLDAARRLPLPQNAGSFFYMAPLIITIAATNVLQARVRFPISRERLARTEFASTLCQAAIAGLGVFIGTLTLLIGIALSQERVIHFVDVRNIVAIGMLFFPVLPVLLCLLQRTRNLRTRNLLWRGIISGVFGGLFAGVAMSSLPTVEPFLFSLPGLASCAVLSVVTAALYRHSLRAYYRKTDLQFAAHFRGVFSA